MTDIRDMPGTSGSARDAYERAIDAALSRRRRRVLAASTCAVMAGLVSTLCATAAAAGARPSVMSPTTAVADASGHAAAVVRDTSALATDSDGTLSGLESRSRDAAERVSAIEAAVPETTAAVDRVVVARQLAEERASATADLPSHRPDREREPAPVDGADASVPSATDAAPAADASASVPHPAHDDAPVAHATWSGAVGAIETDTGMSQSELLAYTRRAWNASCPSAALSATPWLVVIDTDAYLTTVFQSTAAGWVPTRCWHSVGGDANRGHTAEGTLWVTGRARDPEGAGDPWFVTFNAWPGSPDTEGQAFHYWKEPGRTMDGTGSDGCDMLGWDQARWVWENVGDGTAVYSIPGRLTSDYGGETQKLGHTYFHVWSEAECAAAGAMP